METCEWERYITSTKERKLIKRCWSGAVVACDGVQKYDYFVLHACVVMWLKPVCCSSWRHKFTKFLSIFLFSVQSFTLRFRVGQTVQFLSFVLMSCLSLNDVWDYPQFKPGGSRLFCVSVRSHLAALLVLLLLWLSCSVVTSLNLTADFVIAHTNSW